MAAKTVSPTLHAGLGLIFRLNFLWPKADGYAEAGDYDAWNVILDVIHATLSYRKPMEIFRDENGKIVDARISEDANEVYLFLTKRVFEAKTNYYKMLRQPGATSTTKNIQKSRWYRALRNKDIWLRKYMHELGLYLKETEKNLGSVILN